MYRIGVESVAIRCLEKQAIPGVAAGAEEVAVDLAAELDGQVLDEQRVVKIEVVVGKSPPWQGAAVGEGLEARPAVDVDDPVGRVPGTVATDPAGPPAEASALGVRYIEHAVVGIEVVGDAAGVFEQSPDLARVFVHGSGRNVSGHQGHLAEPPGGVVDLRHLHGHFKSLAENEAAHRMSHGVDFDRAIDAHLVRVDPQHVVGQPQGDLAGGDAVPQVSGLVALGGPVVGDERAVEPLRRQEVLDAAVPFDQVVLIDIVAVDEEQQGLSAASLGQPEHRPGEHLGTDRVGR